MALKVVKFGGSSLANAKQVLRAIDIVKADSRRTIVVVSAPGKRHPDDIKITDLLYQWYVLVKVRDYAPAYRVWRRIKNRFYDIVTNLGLELDISHEFVQIRKNVREGASEDYVASRGEYLMAKIMAKALGYEFMDAKDFIRFNSSPGKNGRLATFDRYYNEPLTHSLAQMLLANKCVVIPGFYGAMLDGATIKTFSRNSSDLSAAIVAAALNADVFEKFTDVPGIYAASNEFVENPQSIVSATYRELGELAIDPNGVFHPEAMYPLQAARVRTVILNVNDPSAPGTIIYPDEQAPKLPSGKILGINARRGFSAVTLYRTAMNRQIGFGRRALEVLEHMGISYDHFPSGRDTVSLVIETGQLEGKRERLVERLIGFCQADEVKIEDEIALISTVGRAMRNTAGVAARLLGSLAKVDISTRVIDQGATEMNIVVGVANDDCRKAVNAIYDEFIRE